MKLPRDLLLAPVDGRARPGPPPSAARLRRLAREVREGVYRVEPEEVARAIMARSNARAPRRF